MGLKFEKPGQFSPPFFGGGNFWIFECGAKIVLLTRLSLRNSALFGS